MNISPMVLMVLFGAFVGGIALGVLAGWFTWGTGSPATKDEAKTRASRPPKRGLFVHWDRDANHGIRVHWQGKPYARSWDLPDESRADFQRLLHRLIQWFDQPESRQSKPRARAASRGAPSARPRLDEAATAVRMYAEIDDILQELLQRAQIQRRVHVRFLPQHMQVVVYVDTQSYTSLDDIPDERIRALIREAVRRWERSH
ncbi:MAG: hypothetical protein GXO54_02230 [Chloroflexi bacterium]|nr:hypothetical protein [Chloroflexota bacterium]